jgi:hypothetical protein
MADERDLVPEEPLAVLIRLGEAAGGDFVAETLGAQAQISSRSFLRIAPHGWAVLLEPF